MFSKAERFVNKPVGCGADAVYNVKPEAKAVGGVIPKNSRFKEFKVDKSDTESVNSDKSSSVFRTPKSIRKNILNSANRKLTATKSCSNIKSASSKPLIDEILQSKEVEIRNKDATILEYEQQIKEINNNLNELQNEISSLKESLNNELSARSELQENLALIKSHHTLALEANERIRHEYKIEVDSLKTKHEEEIQGLINRHKTEIDKIKKINDDLFSQINMLEENCEEKIKICEIQYEERLQELKSYTDLVLYKETQRWLSETSKQQELSAETVNKFELQIQELKDQLDVSSNNVKDLSNNVTILEKVIDAKEKQLNDVHSKLQQIENLSNNQKSEIESLTNEVKSANHEKNKFSLILDTTRLTLEALSSRLRKSDEDVEILKAELELSRKEFDDYQAEYNHVLYTVVNSKSALDKSHSNLLEKTAEMSDCLLKMEVEFVEQIDQLKSELFKEIELLKSQSFILLNDLEEKNMNERIKYLEIKEKCDEAYNTIDECKNIMLEAECQLETKDQEINELETENNRLSGTLAAVEQEKNELETLLKEFDLLLKHKDQKILQYIENINDEKKKSTNLEEQVKKISELLNITEYIMKEKETENSELHNEVFKLSNENDRLNSKVSEMNSLLEESESQNNELLMKHAYEKDLLHENIKKTNNSLLGKEDIISDLKHKLSQQKDRFDELESHMKNCDVLSLKHTNAKLEEDLKEMTSKYTNLLGHQNNKQKIKHVADLKTQNSNLKDENEKLQVTVQKQAYQIEKLKKEIELLVGPPARKLGIAKSTPKGKENSPIGKSPKLSEVTRSPLAERQITPFKELNL